jgi:hypothetical protein
MTDRPAKITFAEMRDMGAACWSIVPTNWRSAERVGST